MLVEKIDEKVREHEANTVDLRLRDSKSDDYKAEVDRLKKEVKRLEGSSARRQDQFDAVVKRRDEMEAAAKEFNQIIKARQDAFDTLDKGAKEQDERNRVVIDDLKAQVLGLEEKEKRLKSELGRIG